MTENKVVGICGDCNEQYEYVFNPKYPRKYCPDCSAKRKQAYEDANIPVVKPGLPISSDNQAFKKAPAVNGQLAMYVSYAKDIFVALCNDPNQQIPIQADRMKLATDLVKQAMQELQ